MTKITLQNISSVPIGQLSELPPKELVTLVAEAEEALRQAKLMKDWLDGAVLLKYENKAQEARQQKGTETGTVNFEDDGFKVTATLPKKVSWNQVKLKQAVKTIEENGDNPEEYVETSYKIAESKYKAWPEHIRKFFEEARTLSVGKQTFKIQSSQEVQS